MRSWIKLYTEILDDPDIGSLTWAQRGLFMALLALAGKLDARDGDDMETGRLDTLERTAWHLRCTADELREAVTAFTDRGFIDERDGVLYLTHYPDRQAHRPSEDRIAVAGRVKQHRERQIRGCNENVTTLHENVTSLHENVTSLHENVTTLEKKREEKKRREEKREETPAAHPAPPPAARSPIDHDPIPEVESLRLLHQAFQRGTGQKETETLPVGSARAALRQLLDDDCSADDIEACARYLKAGWWRDKALPVSKVAENIGQWIAQGRPMKQAAQARASPDLAHQSPALSAYRQYIQMQEENDGNGNGQNAGVADLGVSAGQD